MEKKKGLSNTPKTLPNLNIGEINGREKKIKEKEFVLLSESF